jgi:hypothetical protein
MNVSTVASEMKKNGPGRLALGAKKLIIVIVLEAGWRSGQMREALQMCVQTARWRATKRDTVIVPDLDRRGAV